MLKINDVIVKLQNFIQNQIQQTLETLITFLIF